MRIPRRVSAVLAAAALLTTGLAGCSSDDDQAATPTDVLIGADLAASSPTDAAYGRALQLRVDQINASGVLGERRLRLSILDNRSDATISLRNIGALADNPAVAAVITGYCSECTIGAANTIRSKKVPTIALAPADEVVEPVGVHEYLFKIGPNSGDSAAALAGAMKSATPRVTRAGVLTTSDLYGKGAKLAFEGEAKKAGVQIPSSVAVKPTATDITQAVGTLADSEPDALVFFVTPDQAAIAATSAKAAGFKGKIYYDAAAAGDLFIPAEARAASENATMVFTQTLAIDDVIATTPAKAARKQWFRDYTSRYGTYSGVASLAADAVNVLADAIVRNGTDRAAIRAAVETTQMDGMSGAIRITPDNHSGLMPQALTLLVARSGRWRLAG